MGIVSNSAPQPTPKEATPEQVQALLEAARYDDIDDLINVFSTGVPLNSRDSQGRTVDIETSRDRECIFRSHLDRSFALHMASANGHLDIVKYLLQNGADVNALNLEKNTPLHWACLNGHIEVVKALVEGGASVSMLNSYERTPMDEAVSRGKMEVIDAINAALAHVELGGVAIS